MATSPLPPTTEVERWYRLLPSEIAPILLLASTLTLSESKLGSAAVMVVWSMILYAGAALQAWRVRQRSLVLRRSTGRAYAAVATVAVLSGAVTYWVRSSQGEDFALGVLWAGQAYLAVQLCGNYVVAQLHDRTTERLQSSQNSSLPRSAP